jgi:hypothetical protein
MYPEVENYLKTTEKVVVDYTDAVRAARSEFDRDKYHPGYNSYDQAHTRYDEAVKKAMATRNDGLKVIQASLLNHHDEVVQFITRTCLPGYRDEAHAILRELPATFSQLQAIARSHDWCDVWDRFVDQAIEEGVHLQGLTQTDILTRQLLRWVKIEFDWSYEDIDELQNRVEAVVRAETKQ